MYPLMTSCSMTLIKLAFHWVSVMFHGMAHKKKASCVCLLWFGLVVFLVVSLSMSLWKHVKFFFIFLMCFTFFLFWWTYITTMWRPTTTKAITRLGPITLILIFPSAKLVATYCFRSWVILKSWPSVNYVYSPIVGGWFLPKLKKIRWFW